jgi:ABC-type nickel/cobalt efflux system permease component RcnA
MTGSGRGLVPRSRLLHALLAIVVTGAGVLLLLWLSHVAPAFASMLRGAIVVVIALGAWWLFKAVRPRTHRDRRDGERREHRRRDSDPPPSHCEPARQEPTRERR